MLLDAETLNADCACVSIDRNALCRALEAEVGDQEFCRALATTHASLISSLTVFVKPAHAREMAAVIGAIEQVAALPGYRAAVRAHAPEICRSDPGGVGVFMGYDFHLGPQGPRLIEINTNAGGALVNAFIERAQKACCAPVDRLYGASEAGRQDLARFVEIFREEHARQRGPGSSLGMIAIVDDDPKQQYLYPEFELFRHLFRRHGIDAVIADPQDLQHRDGGLWHGQARVDLVYNRLTDFRLDEPGHAALRRAYTAGDVVLTPNPWVHALLADKRNLVRLSDPDVLRGWGVDEATVSMLIRAIPRTIEISREKADELWRERGRYFFKPASGHGSKAAYRGDKITRRVWEAILEGRYVAQEFAAPGLRTVVVDGERRQMKVDVRNYTYARQVLLSAARLYQGQTTNFRTPGGGFAPVLAGLG